MSQWVNESMSQRVSAVNYTIKSKLKVLRPNHWNEGLGLINKLLLYWLWVSWLMTHWLIDSLTHLTHKTCVLLIDSWKIQAWALRCRCNALPAELWSHSVGSRSICWAKQPFKLKHAGQRWPRGQCTRLRMEWSGFGSWPGTLCCVLGQDTLLPRCLSPPRCINRYPVNLMLGITLRWTSIPSRGE